MKAYFYRRHREQTRWFFSLEGKGNINVGSLFIHTPWRVFELYW